jgi:hypothetical protein
VTSQARSLFVNSDVFGETKFYMNVAENWVSMNKLTKGNYSDGEREDANRSLSVRDFSLPSGC